MADLTVPSSGFMPDSSPPEDPNNPYVGVTKFLQEQDQQKLRAAAKTAASINPDQAGKNAVLSDRTGVPADIVAKDYDRIKMQDDVLSRDYQAISQNKGFSDFMKNPSNFAVGQDDFQNMHTLNWLFNAPIKAYNQGQAQVAFGNAKYRSIFYKPTPQETEYMNELDRQMKAGGDLGVESFGGGMITGFSQYVPQFLHSLYSGAKYGLPAAAGGALAGAASGAVGGPAVVLTAPAGAAIGYTVGQTAGMLEYGMKQEAGFAFDEFSKMKDENGRFMDPNVAKVAALAAGGINSGMELAQTKLIMKMFPNWQNITTTPAREIIREAMRIPTVMTAFTGLAKQYGEFITEEVAMEVAQRAVTIASGELAKVAASGNYTHRTTPDIGADLVGEGVGAFQSFALAGVPGVAAHGYADFSAIKEAKSKEALFLEIGKQMAESKVLKRDPATAEKMVDGMTKDGDYGTVYIDPHVYAEYWQKKGIDPKQVTAHIMGDSVEFDNAIETGHDMAIPTPLYATKIAPTEHNTFFASELRFDPSDMNAREVKEFETKQKEQKQQVEDQIQTEHDEIHDTTAQQLEAAGYEKKTASVLAEQMAAFFTTQAVNQGKTPMQMMKDYVLRIAKGDISTKQQPEQTLDQSAYHGSQHEFDRFTTNAIGTGEGAQAFGWGMYFAGSKKTAQWYRDKLTANVDKKDMSIGGKSMEDWFNAQTDNDRFNTDHVRDAMDILLQHNGDIKSTIKDWLEDDITGDIETDADAMSILAVLHKMEAEGVKTNKKKGRLYTVEIPENDQFLDHDGDISVQPEVVQRMMDNTQGWAEKKFIDTVKESVKASENLRILVDKVGKPDTKGWSVMQDGSFERHAVYDRDLNRVSPLFKGSDQLQEARDWMDVQRGAIDSTWVELHDTFKDMKEHGVDDASELASDMQKIIEYVNLIYPNERQEHKGTPEIFHSAEWADFLIASHKADTIESITSDIETGQGFYNLLVEQAQNYLDDNDSNTEIAKFIQQRPDLDPMEQRPFNPPADEMASKFLLHRGVPGLKFLDGSTRNRTNKQGVHNYVIFDDRFVSIKEYEQRLKDDDAARGKLIKYGDYQFDIRILANADLSTFLHESGHLYLEVLNNIVKTKQASPQLQADWAVLMDYLGVKEGGKIEVAHHEKFAESIEQYFMEGKAPSQKLRMAFSRFRVWLTALYQKYVSTGARLNDDVRQVMDRMFATQEEIAAAKQESGTQPIFMDAASAGMTDSEFKNYIKTIELANTTTTEALEQKLMRQLTREKKEWWKNESEKIAENIRKGWKSDTGHQALEMISDKPVEGRESFKLDGPALIAEFGKAKDSELTGAMRTLDAYRSEGGIHHDVAAEVFGYKSGEQMIKDMIRAYSERKAIKDQVEAEMKHRHGDILMDGSIGEEAKQAVADQHQQAVMHAELKALIKLRNQAHPFVAEVKSTERKNVSAGVAMLRGVPPLSVFQKIAKDRIAAVVIRQLRPQTYLVAARVAANKVGEAMGRKDYSVAAMAKQQQLLNMEMYRVARNAVDEVETITRYAGSFERESVRRRIGSAGHDYLDQIDGLLDRFDFRPMSQATEKKRAALRDWLDLKARDGQEVDLPKEIIEEARRRSYKSLTVDELTGIRDVLKHIEHLANTKNRLMRSAEVRELDQLRGMVVDSIQENTRQTGKKSASTHSPADSAKKLFGSWLASHRKLSSYARQLDGFKDGGIVWETVIRPFNEANDAKIRMFEALGPKVKELFKPYAGFMDAIKSEITVATQGLVSKGMYKREYIASIDDSLSMMNRLVVAMNMGNQDNITKLKAGHRWNEAQLADIVEPLTKADWDFVQGIWDLIDSYWPQIKAKQERVLGVAPEKIEANAFNTRYGEYKGGYFPLRYNDELSPKSFAHRAEEMAKDMERGWSTRSTTKRGFTNERVDGVKEPVRLDFGVVFEHLNDVIHDLTHHEALIDVNRVIGSTEVQRNIVDSLGIDAYREMQDAVRSIAAGDAPARGAFERSMNWLRSGVSVAAMGYNLMTAVMQPLGLAPSIVRVGPVWVAKGVAKWIADASHFENTAEWIAAKSTTMRNRSSSMNREIHEMRNTLEGRANRGALQESYFYFITKMQQVVDIPTWLGAYEKAMASNVDEAKAIALADQAVIDSQGSGNIKDLAGIQRGNSLKKLFTTFYSFYSATYNLSAESVGRYKLLRDPISLGRAAVDQLMLYAVPAVLGMMIRDALTKQNGGDDDEDWWLRAAKETGAFMMGAMVGPRELASTIQGYYGYEGPAGSRFYAEMANLIKQVGQQEYDEALYRAINKTAGIVLHYPAVAADKIVRGYVAWSEGTDSPLAVLFGPSK